MFYAFKHHALKSVAAAAFLCASAISASAQSQNNNLDKLGNFQKTGVTEIPTVPQTGRKVDAIKANLAKIKLPPGFKISLYALVQDMRRQRIAMVQTVDQYMLCHRAVKQLFLEQLRVIDSHPYENVGCDGRPLAADSERERRQA